MFKTIAAIISSLIAIVMLGKIHVDTKSALTAKTEEAEKLNRMYKRLDADFDAHRESSSKLIVDMYWDGVDDANTRGRKLTDRPKA